MGKGSSSRECRRSNFLLHSDLKNGSPLPSNLRRAKRQPSPARWEPASWRPGVSGFDCRAEANQAVDGRCLENATGTRKRAVDPPDGLGGGVAGKTGGQGAAHSRLSLLSLPFG